MQRSERSFVCTNVFISVQIAGKAGMSKMRQLSKRLVSTSQSDSNTQSIVFFEGFVKAIDSTTFSTLLISALLLRLREVERATGSLDASESIITMRFLARFIGWSVFRPETVCAPATAQESRQSTAARALLLRFNELCVD